MISPERAPVRPRVILPETGDTIPLEDVVLEFQGRLGEALAIIGGAGSGKTTALAHVAAVLGENVKITFLDEPLPAELYHAVSGGAVVITLREPEESLQRISYHLAPWTDDDLAEYLLSRHPRQCASVMRRIRAAADRETPAGLPELWRVALDRMAEDESVVTVSDALRCELRACLQDREDLEAAQHYQLVTLTKSLTDAKEAYGKLRSADIDDRAFLLLRHDPVRLLLAADWLARLLESPRGRRWLKQSLPRRLVQRTGPLLTPSARQNLLRTLDRWNKSRQAMAASLLHAAGPGWVPDSDRAYNLTGAYLAGAKWPGIRLAGGRIENCDLSDSDLSGGVLDGAAAAEAWFSRANLRQASLKKIDATRADFGAAVLNLVQADFASLVGANLRGADLRGASLAGAVLRSANLIRACLDEADLHLANLGGAKIDGASFANVNFEQADLCGLPLRKANIRAARFSFARLRECDFEELELPAADFHHAILDGALLTSTRMPGANFSHARLYGARLADIDWEGADLTFADLRECTFHFGSSRSGLVGSPLAGEGSRTGFYSDEFDQQTFRPPEEIRKANLCRADLTGAQSANTDFYLVDLRGAKYTADQFEHFRRCGAILFDKG